MNADNKTPEGSSEDGELGDMLQELRVVQEAASLLVGFLLVASFRADFSPQDRAGERWTYLSAFALAAGALVFFLTPAAWHRIQRPLPDRVAFKRSASRLMLVGQALLSAGLTLSLGLSVSEAAGRSAGFGMAALIGGLIVTLWWAMPLARRRGEHPSTRPRN